jgi:hypothetical protein
MAPTVDFAARATRGCPPRAADRLDARVVSAARPNAGLREVTEPVRTLSR